jgi:hypothetical protein
MPGATELWSFGYRMGATPMADWLVYWRLFGSDDEPWPVTGWRIKKGSRLTEVKKGDRLWLIASGENCKECVSSPVTGAGYLAEIFTVDHTVIDDDGYYRFTIWGDEDRCVDIDPPLAVDAHLKAISKNPTKHVGMRCQTPRIMQPLTVDAMKKQLKQRYPNQYPALFDS